MALCDFLIESDIQGYDCSNPMVKGAEEIGWLINRADINSYSVNNFQASISLKCPHRHGYRITQGGKQPFNGTQQELVEGANQNTMTNTVQFVVLKQDADTAQQLFALMNGEFVAVIVNKNGTNQVYGLETGLHCSAAVRELYNDDVLAGWQVTMTEEGATLANIFVNNTFLSHIEQPTGPCE